MACKNSNILLLQAPATLKKEDVSTFGFFPPLGLAYIAGILLQDGFEVEIKDLLTEGAKCRELTGEGFIRLGLPERDIERLLSNKAPKIVGISNNFTSFSSDCIRLARLVRKALPDSLIVLGGAHASMEPETLLSTGVVNVVVKGEGELIFRDLVKAVFEEGLESARKISGTVWAIEGKIIDNGNRQPIADLDMIPFPAYQLLPMHQYIWQRRANFAVVMRRPVGHMITTRGCPYDCIFCSTTKHFKEFRKRSPENVLTEMKMLMRDFGIREFHFHDDNFMADPEHVHTLCQKIIQEKLDIRWQVSQGINSVLLDEELLGLMHKSGMYRMGFPIESGCEKTLRFIAKVINLNRVKRLIEKCNYLGIYCFGCFMIGFPEETREELNETIDFIIKSNLDYVKICITQPLAGSRLYLVFQRLLLCDKEKKKASTYEYTIYDTAYFKAEELNRIRLEILRAFSRQRIKNLFKAGGMRRFIFPKLRSLENILYFVKVSWLAFYGY